MNNFFLTVLLFITMFFLSSCNKGADRDELRNKSMARADIISRSGSLIADEKVALVDAQNRLRTGGGLFGKKAESIDFFTNNKNSNSVSSIGFPINPSLWKASLEVVEFMPLSSTDPFGGIIITDWYFGTTNNERCKLNIFIKGMELRSNNIKVNSFCQSQDSQGDWQNIDMAKDSNLKLENAILNKAKKIKLSIN